MGPVRHGRRVMIAAGWNAKADVSLHQGDTLHLLRRMPDGVAQLVMSLVYPDLKALFESSTRRITIIVGWHEGSSERDLTLVQWVTQPQPPPPLNPDDLGGEPGAPTPAPTSSGPSTGRAPSPSGKKPGDMR